MQCACAEIINGVKNLSANMSQSQQHISLHVHVRICSHRIQSLQCQDIFSRDNFLFFFLQRERSMGLVDHLLWILSSVSGLSFLELILTGTDNTSINGGGPSCLFQSLVVLLSIIMFCLLGKCLMNSGLLHMKILRLVTGQLIHILCWIFAFNLF